MKKNVLRGQDEDAKMSIEESTKLYAIYVAQEKEAKLAAAKYKPAILEYVNDNPDRFVGNTMTLPNGVSVECRVLTKAKWDDHSVTLDWIEGACDAGLEEAIVIKIDYKKFPHELDSQQKGLLNDINFETEENESFAIYVS
jgi:hypothetical protein